MGNNSTLTLACDASLISVRDQLAGALCDLDTARVGAPPGHPVRSYLTLSQLAAVANIRSMCGGVRFEGMPPRFPKACRNATIRIGSCFATRYNDKPDRLVEAAVKDVCGGRSLGTNGLVWSLVSKSGIDEAQINAVCP